MPECVLGVLGALPRPARVARLILGMEGKGEQQVCLCQEGTCTTSPGQRVTCPADVTVSLEQIAQPFGVATPYCGMTSSPSHVPSFFPENAPQRESQLILGCLCLGLFLLSGFVSKVLSL